MKEIEVHELVGKGYVSSSSTYRVIFPCCGDTGVITRQQIRRWQNGHVRYCKACSAAFKTKREDATGYTVSPEKEARIGKELADFTKLMYELNHA